MKHSASSPVYQHLDVQKVISYFTRCPVDVNTVRFKSVLMFARISLFFLRWDMGIILSDEDYESIRMDHTDSDVKLEVMGHEHQHKNSHESHKSLAEEYFGQFEFVDWDTIEMPVRQVIGGGTSPWASVELVSTGKFKKGKPIHHEFVFITHFNDSGKIDVLIWTLVTWMAITLHHHQ